MKHWKVLLFAVLIAALSAWFAAIMRPPGAKIAASGLDMPWQIRRSQDGGTITVFGLTLGQSTVRDAVNQLGRRYELGLFEDQGGRLSLEVYFREAVVGGLNARLAMTAYLPNETLIALKTHAGNGKPVAEGGRRYPVAEQDQALAVGAVLTGVTFIPIVKFDAELVRKRFGEPAEWITAKDGAHWLYPAIGLDVLLGANGEAVLQYAPPPEFESRLHAPLRRN